MVVWRLFSCLFRSNLGAKHLLSLHLHARNYVASLTCMLLSFLINRLELIEVTNELFSQAFLSLLTFLIPLCETVSEVDFLLCPLLKNGEVMLHEVQVEENLTLGHLLQVLHRLNLIAKVDEDLLGDRLREIHEIVTLCRLFC